MCLMTRCAMVFLPGSPVHLQERDRKAGSGPCQNIGKVSLSPSQAAFFFRFLTELFSPSFTHPLAQGPLQHQLGEDLNLEISTFHLMNYDLVEDGTWLKKILLLWWSLSVLEFKNYLSNPSLQTQSPSPSSPLLPLGFVLITSQRVDAPATALLLRSGSLITPIVLLKAKSRIAAFLCPLSPYIVEGSRFLPLLLSPLLG